MSATITTTKRQKRTMTRGEAFATHCRFVAGLLKGGVQLPADAAQVHAEQLEAMASHFSREPDEDEAGPALPLIGGAGARQEAA